MFETAQLPGLNSQAKSIFHQVGNKSSNVDHDHGVVIDALVNLKVLAWSGPNAGDAATVMHQVASRASNFDRGHAQRCEAAIGSTPPTLSLIVAP